MGIGDSYYQQSCVIINEDSISVSRDEIVSVFLEVSMGQIPTNIIALRILVDDMKKWAKLEKNSYKKTMSKLRVNTEYARISEFENAKSLTTEVRKKTNIPKINSVSSISKWGGYSILYLITTLPLIFLLTIIFILISNFFK